MKLLVVEDDRLLNNTLCYNLSTTGFVVDSAVSKKEAEHFCEKQEYDLIVLDINLPDGNGFDFCRAIKEHRPDTAVIFLTARDLESDQLRGREALKKALKALEDGYAVKPIGQAEFAYAKKQDWTCDWCSQYKDYSEYKKKGLGFVVYHENEIVAGASAYSCYQGGIEIAINTKEDYRRKGLAYAVATRLILECLDRNLYPIWDASNLWSVELAKKLGYHFEKEYTAYYVYYDSDIYAK